MALVGNFIKSDREGNWDVRILIVEELLPLFAAFEQQIIFVGIPSIWRTSNDFQLQILTYLIHSVKGIL